MRFLVYLEPDEDGGYVVSVPSLPGCVSQGETVEEALEMIRDAIAGYIATLKAHGQPIPHGVEQGRDVKRGTLRSILQQAGISVDDFTEA